LASPFEQILKGEDIDYRFRRTSDDHLHITDVYHGDDPTQGEPEIGAESPDVPGYLAPAHLALRAAIETVGDGVEDDGERIEKVIDTAGKYRAYFEESEYESAGFG
jgi:hypothetical protein